MTSVEVYQWAEWLLKAVVAFALLFGRIRIVKSPDYGQGSSWSYSGPLARKDGEP